MSSGRRYIAKADISADIWHFANVIIGDQCFCLADMFETFILTALRKAAPEHTFSLLFAVVIISSV